MLTMRVTPKISDRPADRKKSEDAFARPFKAWTNRTSSGSLLLRRPHLPHVGVGRLYRRAVDVAELLHGPGALLDRRLADPGAHRALMVDGAVHHRSCRRVHAQSRERGHHLLRVGAARLGDAGGERLERDVTDERAEARVVVEALLVGGDEALVRRRVDLVPRIAGDDPAFRHL